MGKEKKKYQSGEGAQYISRRSALKKLQLSLNDFRRLCIVKGIYPREPRNRKRAQKGVAGTKTLYHIKDIQFLMQEPIIWKLRDSKVFNRKVSKARSIKDFESMRRHLSNHPTIKLDHIVKERYPTFMDAVRDLDDCLTLCFLFSTFPSMKHIHREQSQMCRRLTVEFMHAMIESKSLRKVFVSIKGYYYQAEIMGETVTWIVPHHFSFEPQNKHEVNFQIMSTFVEFYTIMLGFINFRLYHSLNLHYPPKFTSDELENKEKDLVDEEAFVSERVAALSCGLKKVSMNEGQDEEVEIDTFTTNDENLEEVQKQQEEMKQLKVLFKGLKFFLNREVPREPLVFLIRSFGGLVSWDKTLFVGSTFDENDETITHQIVDRPTMVKQFISRYYVQPQWLFDSVNARKLLPVNGYFIGAVLPPHLSPFVIKDRENDYVPPEEEALYDPSLLEALHKKDEEEVGESSDEEQVSDTQKESDEEIENDEDATSKSKLSVSTGKVEREAPNAKKKQEKQEFRLREMMVRNKHKFIYKNLKRKNRKSETEVKLLAKKRRLLEKSKKSDKKTKKSSST